MLLPHTGCVLLAFSLSAWSVGTVLEITLFPDRPVGQISASSAVNGPHPCIDSASHSAFDRMNCRRNFFVYLCGVCEVLSLAFNRMNCRHSKAQASPQHLGKWMTQMVAGEINVNG